MILRVLRSSQPADGVWSLLSRTASATASCPLSMQPWGWKSEFSAPLHAVMVDESTLSGTKDNYGQFTPMMGEDAMLEFLREAIRQDPSTKGFRAQPHEATITLTDTA